MDQMSVVNIAAMVVAVLAAKGNSQVSQAAMAAASAGSLQARINYTREFEREADRVGFTLLESAGFDVTAMPVFFERLQKAGRVYETGAPAYLRTHPLTIERISDMQNRIKDSHYRQTQDGPDFHFVKARLRAELGRPQEAVAAFEEQLSERRFTSESAAHYGLAFALNRAKQFVRADSEINWVRKNAAFNPMVESLAARNKLEAGAVAEATEILRAASARLPAYRPLQYAMVDLLQASGQHAAAVNLLLEQVKNHPREIKLHGLLSKSYAALGKRLLSHQSLAETYYLQGALVPAQEQLQLALKAGDGDFYAMSRIDARLREVRQRMAEEKRQR
jgi:predicted Zn-dependent protease